MSCHRLPTNLYMVFEGLGSLWWCVSVASVADMLVHINNKCHGKGGGAFAPLETPITVLQSLRGSAGNQ